MQERIVLALLNLGVCDGLFSYVNNLHKSATYCSVKGAVPGVGWIT